jgi:hypothetical protein
VLWRTGDDGGTRYIYYNESKVKTMRNNPDKEIGRDEARLVIREFLQKEFHISEGNALDVVRQTALLTYLEKKFSVSLDAAGTGPGRIKSLDEIIDLLLFKISQEKPSAPDWWAISMQVDRRRF